MSRRAVQRRMSAFANSKSRLADPGLENQDATASVLGRPQVIVVADARHRDAGAGVARGTGELMHRPFLPSSQLVAERNFRSSSDWDGSASWAEVY